MMASLAVYVAMSTKVDRETLGGAVLPQLWMMAMTPLLSADQFSRFISAIQDMGSRVQREQLAHLQEVKRMQEHTDSYVGGGSTSSLPSPSAPVGQGGGGEVDFATLVGSTGTPSMKDSVGSDLPDFGSTPGFGSGSGSGTHKTITPTLTPSHTGGGGANFLAPHRTGGSFTAPLAPSAPPARARATPSPLAQPALSNDTSAASLFTSSQQSPLASSSPSNGPLPGAPIVRSPGWSSGAPPAARGGTSNPQNALSVAGLGTSLPPLAPTASSLNSLGPITPSNTSAFSSISKLAAPSQPPSAPVGLPPLVPQTSSLGGPLPRSQGLAPSGFASGGVLSPSAAGPTQTTRSSSPAWTGGVLTPSKPPQPARSNASAWADFDPLK